MSGTQLLPDLEMITPKISNRKKIECFCEVMNKLKISVPHIVYKMFYFIFKTIIDFDVLDWTNQKSDQTLKRGNVFNCKENNILLIKEVALRLERKSFGALDAHDSKYEFHMKN